MASIETTAVDFITGIIVDRTQTGTRARVSLDYVLTFEYADGREPVQHWSKGDVVQVTQILESLGFSDRAVTFLLQRGGYAARIPVK
jgi:hypothetical protein